MGESCTICGAPCGSVPDLIEHMHAAHEHDDPTSSVEMNPEAHTPGVVCSLCGRRFPTARALADHNLHPHGRRPEAPWARPVSG